MAWTVVYYSQSGNTEIVAKLLSLSKKAKLKKIEEIGKKRGFFGRISRALDILFNRDVKKNNIRDFSDVLVIGSPVWLGRAAPAVRTFIRKADLAKRKIVLFVTMSGDELTGLKSLEKEVKAKKARVMATFAIKTKDMSMQDIKTAAKAEIAKLRL